MFRNGDRIPSYTWLDTVPEPIFVCELHGERGEGETACTICEDIADGGEWGKAGADAVPVAYALQVQHYLAVVA